MHSVKTCKLIFRPKKINKLCKSEHDYFTYLKIKS